MIGRVLPQGIGLTASSLGCHPYPRWGWERLPPLLYLKGVADDSPGIGDQRETFPGAGRGVSPQPRWGCGVTGGTAVDGGQRAVVGGAESRTEHQTPARRRVGCARPWAERRGEGRWPACMRNANIEHRTPNVQRRSGKPPLAFDVGCWTSDVGRSSPPDQSGQWPACLRLRRVGAIGRLRQRPARRLRQGPLASRLHSSCVRRPPLNRARSSSTGWTRGKVRSPGTWPVITTARW